MPYVLEEPSYRLDEPMQADEFENIINSTSKSGLMNWWEQVMSPAIKRLDEQLEGKDIYA